jgi:hypothetical protein
MGRWKNASEEYFSQSLGALVSMECAFFPSPFHLASCHPSLLCLLFIARPRFLSFVSPLSDYVRRYASVALFLDEEEKAGRNERGREAGRPTQSSPAPSAGVPRQHPHRGRQPSLSSSVVGGVGGKHLVGLGGGAGGDKGEDSLTKVSVASVVASPCSTR